MKISFDEKTIIDFCVKWKVREFYLFGSVLREDFASDSDIDVLVDLIPGHGLTLYDWQDMRDDLERIFGRRVDLVAKSGLRNPIRRHEILTSAHRIYAA